MIGAKAVDHFAELVEVGLGPAKIELRLLKIRFGLGQCRLGLGVFARDQQATYD